jgi:hypothetical protein
VNSKETPVSWSEVGNLYLDFCELFIVALAESHTSDWYHIFTPNKFFFAYVSRF